MNGSKIGTTCGHCGARYDDQPNLLPLGVDEDGGWMVDHHLCPYCHRLTVRLLTGPPTYHASTGEFENVIVNGLDGQKLRTEVVRPHHMTRPPCPPEVQSKSPDIADDYTEACLIAALSPKGSAAMSRRALQNLLREKANVKHGDLASEIQEVLDSKALPSSLAEQIDAIRNMGNFAAHPLNSTSSGAILPVEAEEANWNLDVLEDLFDFYYVAPAKSAAKLAALNQKLAGAKKPPVKTP